MQHRYIAHSPSKRLVMFFHLLKKNPRPACIETYRMLFIDFFGLDYARRIVPSRIRLIRAEKVTIENGSVEELGYPPSTTDRNFAKSIDA